MKAPVLLAVVGWVADRATRRILRKQLGWTRAQVRDSTRAQRTRVLANLAVDMVERLREDTKLPDGGPDDRA